MSDKGNSMATQAPEYIDAIAHMPVGSTLTLTNIPWKDYEQLLDDLGDGYAVRISYDNGRLEIMSPSTRHEVYKELIVRLADTIALEMDLPLESCGSTTFKQKRFAKAAEPDTCFYIQNAAAIIGKMKIDLN